MITVLKFWRTAHSYSGLIRMATCRKSLRSLDYVSFHKLLGTGKGETFTPSDADPNVWGIIAVLPDASLRSKFEQSKPIRSFDEVAIQKTTIEMSTINSIGNWSGVQPFGESTENTQNTVPIAAITRARLNWKYARRFWRETPPVTASLHNAPGLINAIGIGEAPIGLQGTFSIWRNEAALKDFAYSNASHRKAIELTHQLGWYQEELFARFKVDRIEDEVFNINLMAE